MFEIKKSEYPYLHNSLFKETQKFQTLSNEKCLIFVC